MAHIETSPTRRCTRLNGRIQVSGARQKVMRRAAVYQALGKAGLPAAVVPDVS